MPVKMSLLNISDIPSQPPILIRSIECNMLAFYYSIIDSNYSELEEGTTVLFEWALDPFSPASEENEYTFGYVRYNKEGREFIYEKRYGKLKELKSEFTISYI